MAFEKRLQKGNEWAEKVQQIIEGRGWKTVPMGAENLAPDIHKALSGMKNPDPTASFVRYLPDGFAVNVGKEQAFFFDAKAGNSIQKEAYEAYLAFAGKNRRVFVFIEAGGKTYCVPVQELKFQNSHEVVAGYPMPLPVDGDGWIAPRLLPFGHYLSWKNRFPQASGTPYRRFDLVAMAEYRIGKEITK